MPIRLIFLLAFLNNTTVNGARVLLTLYALESGAPPYAIGLLATTFAMFPVLLAWVSGRMTDRFGSRWLFVLGTTGVAMGMLVPYLVPGLTAIFVAGAMCGFASTFYTTSIQNLVGLLSTSSRRAQNYSNYSLIGSVASFSGPLLVGIAIDHSGYKAAFAYVIVLQLVQVMMLVLWGGRLPRGTRNAEPVGNIFRTLANPGVWRVLAASSLQQTGTDIFKFYIPVYAHAIGLSAPAIGVILAMPAAAGFAIRLALPQLIDRYRAGRVLVYALIISMISLVLIPFFKITTALALISFMFGLGINCCQPITMMLMFDRSAAGRSGEAMGLRLTADNLTKLITPALFGVVASAFGLAFVFWCNGLMLGVGGMLFRPRTRRGGGLG